ncbi:peptidase inhibitor family I36 protein [Aeromicrobium fastidiosum]|uniref:Peptidase inhibitor family I36 protein n=1 Tax=Aeromicrobium fastidiosum TaxID=52699 RepID=A0A641AJ41_9ACTN|nr:peptidase inhibitor family I36 protein [Aeromicrobium fastidiosum]KAA1374913.1 hypothetical protein ESP62_016210 [Aeromicrobium fastidiosum]MBP2390515.1 hypothetical protein [Aeromicrobium fastidiosum]
MNYSNFVAKSLPALLLGTVLFLQPNIAQANEMSPNIMSQCSAGYFCVWSGTNFTGQFQRIAATNSYRGITLTATKSYYNNRMQRTWLHSDPSGGGSSLCINPGAAKANTSGWQAEAEAAYLATVTSC